MSVLAYCVSDSEIDATPQVGVANAAVVQASAAGFTIFFSEEEFDLGSEERIRASALAFHQVNDAIFHVASIVPFRFPTLLPSIQELESFIERNRETFEASLDATRDRVQMEVWIYARQPDAQPEVQVAPTGGRAYLQEKATAQRELLRQAEAIRQRAESYMVEWAQAEQRGSLRCYALVAREDVASFRQAAGATGADDLKLRVTGPWPATKFMPLDRMQPVPPSHNEVLEL